jgi:hypothetical protein
MNVVVIAATSTGAPLAYLEQPGVTYTPGGSTTIAGPWQALASIAATYSNPTGRVTRADLYRFTPHLRGRNVTGTNNGSGTIQLSSPATATAAMQTIFTCDSATSSECVSNALGTAYQTHTELVDGTQTTYAHDIGAHLLPWLSTTYTPSTTTLNVTVTGTGAIDIFQADLRYFRAVSVPACSNQYIYTWRVFGPQPASITFPALPSALPGDPTVRSTDVQSAYHAFVGESDAIAGYRDAIANPYEALARCEALGPSLPPTKPLWGTRSRLSRSN